VSLLLLAALAACVFGLLASFVINRASGKSPLWNVGFGLFAVLGDAALLLAAIVLLIRAILGPSA
jgi:hypothetical protein